MIVVHGNFGERYSTYKAFIKALKVMKSKIFPHKSDIPRTLMGLIHVWALQLLVNGIINLKVSDRTKIGATNLNEKDITVALGNGKDYDCVILPDLCTDSCVIGMA